MEKHTYRQLLLWEEYLDDPGDQLTPTQWLLARIAQRVQQVLRTKPDEVSLKHQQVALETKLPLPETEEQKTERVTKEREAHKQTWLSMFGFGKDRKRGRRNRD